MKKSRFTEQQIAYALRQAESGIHVEEITSQRKRALVRIKLDVPHNREHE